MKSIKERVRRLALHDGSRAGVGVPSKLKVDHASAFTLLDDIFQGLAITVLTVFLEMHESSIYYNIFNI